MSDVSEGDRDAVIDALIGLFDDGVYQPTLAEVAERAGISKETLFTRFEDIEDLTRAAIDRSLDLAVTLVEPRLPPDATTDEKIDALVASRVRLFDAVAPAARAARALAYRNKVVAAQTDDTRAFLRGQLSRLFAPELERNPDALAVLDVLGSFEAYDMLCHAQGLSLAKAEAVLSAAFRRLLA